MDKQEVFYDIECYPYNSLVVFKDIDKNIIGYAWDEFSWLAEFLEDKVVIGFNNYWYDDYMLSYMIRGYAQERLKGLNDEIIGGRKHAKYIHPGLDSLDVFQQIDVSKPGLKKIEGNMGKMILESSVPFDLPRPLTEEEKQEAFEYCCYDVDQVVDLYKMRKKNYFESKHSLIQMLGKDNVQRWNTTTLVANLLMPKPIVKWASIRVPEHIWNLAPESAREIWTKKNINPDAKVSPVTVREFDNDFVFGFGGLHSENVNQKVFRDVVLVDVALTQWCN